MAAQAGEWLHAVFSSSADVREALDRLTRDGVLPENIELRSSAPLGAEFAPAGVKLTSKVPWIATLGGVLGGAAAFSLVRLTSEAYPMRTGRMPVFPLPPAGIITFEGVAVGAILFTVATVLYECGLPGRRPPGPLDSYLADDCVLISVRCAEDASTLWTSKAIETLRS